MQSLITLLDYEACCAAGQGLHALRSALRDQRSGLRPNNVEGSDLETWVGAVPGIDELEAALSPRWRSRNNALIELGLRQGRLLEKLEQLKTRYGSKRIAVIMGSSTSSIDRAERAYRHLDAESHLTSEFNQPEVLNVHAPGLYVAARTGLEGPALTINTACSSSAKVFATAARWLQMGFVDAALVGGADILCLSVLHGFHALQLVSSRPCRPFDAARDGINLGEAAGFALMARAEDWPDNTGVVLSGYGESSDAHHMSHPHPEGAGARRAIEQALSGAGLRADDIDYINLHGTASLANDRVEGRLVASMFPSSTRASSTKGWMGHTLGAAGIIESIIALDTLVTGMVPGTLNFERCEPGIPLALSADNQLLKPRHVMSNSFGFGGNNACLIFSQLPEASV